MQRELVLRAITEGITGIIFLTLLLVLLFALRKDIRAKTRLSGIVVFTLAMLSLWCFAAFAKVYVSVRKIIVSQYALDDLTLPSMVSHGIPKPE
jgi:hypothetical protein